MNTSSHIIISFSIPYFKNLTSKIEASQHNMNASNKSFGWIIHFSHVLSYIKPTHFHSIFPTKKIIFNKELKWFIGWKLNKLKNLKTIKFFQKCILYNLRTKPFID